MGYRSALTSKWLLLVPLLAVLIMAVACGEEGTPVIIEKQVVVEKEVIKEVPVIKEVVVEKEIIKEVIKEVPVEVEKEVVVVKEIIVEVPVEKIIEIVTTPIAAPRAAIRIPAYVKKAKYGGTPAFAATSDPGFLDLHFSASINSGLVVGGPRFNQLVEFNPVNWSEIQGDLATTWDLRADGRTYTFFLHPDAKWTDGKPVTAEDVVFSLDRVVDPDAIRPRAGGALRPFYTAGNARAIDASIVEMTTKFPSTAFLSGLAFDYVKIYPKHIAEQLSQDDMNCCYENMLGSGPWMVKKFERGSVIEWEKNPNYFKEGLPFWDGWNSFLIKDRVRALAGMKTEQVMGWTAIIQSSPTFDLYQQLEKDTGGKVKAIQVQGSTHLGIHTNHTKPPFDDVRVRKALQMAVDRVEIIKTAYKGFGRQATYLPGGTSIADAEANWAGWRYVDSSGNLITTDPVKVVGAQKHPDDIAEAKALVKAAGAENFKGRMISTQDPAAGQVAVLLARQLKELFGWDMSVDVMDLPAYSIERNEGRFNMHGAGHGMELNDPNALLTQMHLEGGGRNQQNWHDERIDKLFVEQNQALNADARKAKILEIEKIMVDEGISQWTPIAWLPVNGAMNVKIRNYFLPAPTDVASAWNIQANSKKEHMWLDPDAKADWGLGN